MAGRDKALPFLAVGRVIDATTLASYSESETPQHREQTEEIFKKLLTAARQKLKPGQRTRLQWNDGSVCCLMDQKGMLLFCVVTSFMEYPERFAYALLQELMQAVGQIDSMGGVTIETAAENGLAQELTPRMQKMLVKYEDPANFDQTHQALDKVKVVHSKMQENIRQVAETGRSVHDLQGKTDTMASSAKMFKEVSQDVRDKYSRRNRMCFFAVGIALIILIAVVVWKLMNTS